MEIDGNFPFNFYVICMENSNLLLLYREKIINFRKTKKHALIPDFMQNNTAKNLLSLPIMISQVHGKYADLRRYVLHLYRTNIY